jgi:hypothetical protein
MSHEISAEHQRYHGVPVKRMITLSNGVDTQSFARDNRSAARQSVRDELGLSKEAGIHLFDGHEFDRKGLKLRC